MIINSSRASVFLKCKKDCFNRHHRRLEGPRAIALTDGGAVHEAIAVGLATKDWEEALAVARVKFDKDVADTFLLEEERPLIEQHWNLVTALTRVFAKGFEGESYQVIQPECAFDVELPVSGHHCVFVHWRDIDDPPEYQPRLGPPPPDFILSKRVVRCRCQKCYVSHRLVGKTDAIVAWRNNIWLLEHKTTAMLGAQFWDSFLLDLQPTTYLYGIKRSLNVRPSGFVLNALYKPSEAQVKNWTKGRGGQIADYVKYEREVFLRTPEDLERVEAQYIEIADEWEERIVSGRWPMSNIKTVCLQYNRKCDFMGACLAHDKDGSLEGFQEKARDYVEEKLTETQKLIQVQKG